MEFLSEILERKKMQLNWRSGFFAAVCSATREKNDNYGKKTHNEAKIMFEFVFKFETMSYSNLITWFYTKSEITICFHKIFIRRQN